MGKRSDGYHDIESIFQSLELHDTVSVEESLQFEINCSVAPLNSARSLNLLESGSNIALSAAKWFTKKFDVAQSFRVNIEKRIPISAGLGGGSSDAAAVILALNEMTGKDLPLTTLAALSAEIGADVPYFVLGGSLSKVMGLGEKVTPLPSLPEAGVVLLKIGAKISTATAYEELDAISSPMLDNFDKVLVGAQSGSWRELGSAMDNIFLRIPSNDEPVNMQMLKIFVDDAEVLGAGLTGSGPSLFAICEIGQEEALADRTRRAVEALCSEETNINLEIIASRTCSD